jgi:hypothetical protein
MLAFTFRLVYQHTCKKYLAAVRKYLASKRPLGLSERKKPAGVTPSASSCDCRLDFRCHRDLRQACIGIVNERLTGQFIPGCGLRSL